MPPTLSYFIPTISYNSRCVAFPDWITLFTLCLAPLIVHIASGAPPVSYLTRSRPKWYDYLCHYHPTSILWRYAAIADRRIRATRWSRNDLAASNAIFWTENGWSGGEEMVCSAAPYCSKSPESTHAEIISVTMLKTTITTLQGISALYSVIGLLTGVTTTNFVPIMGVDMIFYPVSVLGLLRLCAATWLTEDFHYASTNTGLSNILTQGTPKPDMDDLDIQLMEFGDILDPCLARPLQRAPRFTPPRSSRPSIVFRAFYLLVLGGIWGVSFLHTVPAYYKYNQSTTTSFLVAHVYFLLLAISLGLYTFYFFRGQTTTTVLPCISSIWYRVYTMLVTGFTLALIVVASIETNKRPDGLYTSEPPRVELKCSDLKGWWQFKPNSTRFGFALTVEENSTWLGKNYSSVPVARVTENHTLLGEKYWLYNFTGYCFGRLENIAR